MKRKYVVSPQDLIFSLKKECNWNKEDEEKLL